MSLSMAIKNFRLNYCNFRAVIIVFSCFARLFAEKLGFSRPPLIFAAMPPRGGGASGDLRVER